MKKSFYLLLLITLYSSISFAQSLKSISILGDSYSTFEGYLQPFLSTKALPQLW